VRIVGTGAGLIFQGNGDPSVPRAVLRELGTRRWSVEVRVFSAATSQLLRAVGRWVESERMTELVGYHAKKDSATLHRLQIGDVQSDVSEDGECIARADPANLCPCERALGAVDSPDGDKDQWVVVVFIQRRLTAETLVSGTIESKFTEILGKSARPPSDCGDDHRLLSIRYRTDVTDLDAEMRCRRRRTDDGIGRTFVACEAQRGGQRHQRMAHLSHKTIFSGGSCISAFRSVTPRAQKERKFIG